MPVLLYFTGAWSRTQRSEPSGALVMKVSKSFAWPELSMTYTTALVHPPLNVTVYLKVAETHADHGQAHVGLNCDVEESLHQKMTQSSQYKWQMPAGRSDRLLKCINSVLQKGAL